MSPLGNDPHAAQIAAGAPVEAVATPDEPNRRHWRTDSGNVGTEEPARARRCDRGELLRAHRTTEGYLLIEGRAARPGVLTYRNADGSTTRELVLPEELHRTDSLATLARKPVTVEHPSVPVGPDNVRELGVGDVDGEVAVEEEGGFVRVKLVVSRRDGIDAIDSDGIRELSPGYDCRIDATPGTHPTYGAYDQIQRDRRYNHLALTERARGGPEIRFRVDGASVQVDPFPIEDRPMHPKLLLLLAQLVGATNVKRRTDAGRTDEVDEATIDAAIAKANEIGTKLAELMPLAGTADELRGQIAALKTQVAGLEAKLAAAESAATSAPAPEAMVEAAAEMEPLEGMDAAGQAAATPEMKRMDAVSKAVRRVGEERAKLEAAARNLRIDAKDTAKLGLAGLRKLVVTTANPQARKDADAAYYRVAVDMLPAGLATRADAAGDGADPYAAISDGFRADRATERADADRAREDADPMTKLLSGFAKRRAEIHRRVDPSVTAVTANR